MIAGLKRAGMTSLFAVFTLLGVGMALLADGSERLLGLAIVLFMGGGGIAWFVVTAGTRHTGLRIGTINALGRYETGFIADYDSRRQLAGAVGALSMAAAAFLLGVVPDSEGSTVVPWWLGIGMGLLIGAIGVVGAARGGRGSHLVLTPHGVAAVSAVGPIFVPWTAIASIGEMAVRGAPFLVVQVTDPSLVEMGRAQRLMHIIQRTVMNVDLSFPLSALRTDPKQVRAALERYAARSDLRRLIGTPAELGELPGPGGAARERAARPSKGGGRSVSRVAAAISLLVFGTLLGLLTLAAAVDDVTPAQERGRWIGLALFLLAALCHVAGGVLFVRGSSMGRWVGLAAAALALGLAGLVLASSDEDSRAIAFAIGGVSLVHAALVIWGVMRWRRREPAMASATARDTADLP